jgi:hypothetical protein
MKTKMLERVGVAIKARTDAANRSFNRLPSVRKKVALLVFGAGVTAISASLVIRAIEADYGNVHFKPEQIAVPHDIFMKDEAGVLENQLTPVGKMKGEIDGEFESFYVAVDSRGSIYINREIEYSERAYEKTEDWKQISREKLMEYEKDLHFIPSKSKGIGR